MKNKKIASLEHFKKLAYLYAPIEKLKDALALWNLPEVAQALDIEICQLYIWRSKGYIPERTATIRGSSYRFWTNEQVKEIAAYKRNVMIPRAKRKLP